VPPKSNWSLPDAFRGEFGVTVYRLGKV